MFIYIHIIIALLYLTFDVVIISIVTVTVKKCTCNFWMTFDVFVFQILKRVKCLFTYICTYNYCIALAFDANIALCLLLLKYFFIGNFGRHFVC
jgi:hypothetical protein